MKNYEDNRRPEEIEHDIEQTRAQLSSNIDAIQSKLTPGQMMDQAIGYARTSLPADFGSNLNTAIRQNPIPVALIGLGMGWLMMSGKQRPGYLTRHSRSSRSAHSYYLDDPHAPGSGFADEHGIEFGGLGDVNDHGVGGHITGDHDSAMHRASSRMSETGHDWKNRASQAGQDWKNRATQTGHDMRSRASETAHDLKTRASETSQHLRDRASSTSQGIKERMSATGQSIRDKASSLSSRFSESTSSMGDRSRGMAHNARARAGELGQRSQQQYYRTRDNLTQMAEEQPLMLGALGLAVGALLGAMVPATRREDELMGETRDQFFERGKEMARQQAEAVKSSAQRVADTAKEEAQRVAGQARQQGDGRSYHSEGTGSADETNRGAQSLH